MDGRTESNSGTHIPRIPDLRNVDHQPLFCNFCARAKNVSEQPCHLGTSCPSGKEQDREEFRIFFHPSVFAPKRKTETGLDISGLLFKLKFSWAQKWTFIRLSLSKMKSV